MFLFTHPKTCFLVFVVCALIFGIPATREKGCTFRYITGWFIVMSFFEFMLSPL